MPKTDKQCSNTTVEKLRTNLLQDIPLPACLVNQRLKVEACNHAFQDMLKLSLFRKNRCEEQLNHIFPKSSMDLLSKRISQANKVGRNQQIEVQTNQHNWYRVDIGTRGSEESSLCIWTDISREKLWEEEADSKDAIVKQLLAVSNEAIRIVDSNFKVIFANDAYCKINQLNEEDILGKPCQDFACSGLCNTETCTLKSILSKYAGIEREVKLFINGKERYFLQNAQPYFDNNGLLMGMTESFRDISKTKKTLLQVKSSEEKFRMLADNTHDVIWACSFDGTLLYLSPSAYQMWQCTNMPIGMKELLEDTENNKPSPVFLQEITEKLKQNLSGFLLLTQKKQKSNGDEFWVETCISAYRNNRGHLIGIVGVARDISSRKAENKKQLLQTRQAESNYRNAPAVLFTIDHKAKITSINQKWTAITGYSEEESLGKAIYFLMTSDSALYFIQNTWPNLLDRQLNEGVNFSLVKRNGEKIELMFLFSTRDENSFLVAAQDTTLLKRKNERINKLYYHLKHLNKINQEILAYLANSLPKFAILPDEKFNKNTDQYQAEHLSFNIHGWLRLQQGGFKSSPQFFDAKNWVSQHYHYFQSMANAKNIVLVNEVPEEARIYADKEIADLVMHNLLDNAIKHTPKEGKICARGHKRGFFLELSVSDEGPGVIIEQLTDFFAQKNGMLPEELPPHSKTQLGLGLTLCKILTEKNLGRIRAENKVGIGSIFTISLPCRNDVSPAI